MDTLSFSYKKVCTTTLQADLHHTILRDPQKHVSYRSLPINTSGNVD